MKNLQKLILLFSLSIIFIACGSSGDPTDGEGTLTAVIDGTSFSSIKASVSAVETSGILQVQGSDSNGNYIRISITSYNGPGTYNTGNAITNTNSLMYGTITPIASWISTFDSGTGSITISSDTDSAVKGTFSFTGMNGNQGSKTITDGSFNAPKQ